MMKLYHGSDTTVDAIDLGKSRVHKDFGRGFYLSADYRQALDFARFKAALPKSTTHKPAVSTFLLDDNALHDGSGVGVALRHVL